MKSLTATVFSFSLLLVLFACQTASAEEISGSQGKTQGKLFVQSGAQVMACDMAWFRTMQTPLGFAWIVPDECISVISPVARYSDVPEGHWAFWYVDAVTYAGITSGCGDGKFCPDKPVTRAELAVFLSKAAGLILRNNLKGPKTSASVKEFAHESQ